MNKLALSVLIVLVGAGILFASLPSVPSPANAYLNLQAATPTSVPMTEEEVMELAMAGVSSNEEWTPYIKEFDGVEMVLVPAGCFMMGSTEEQLDYAVSLGASRSSIEDEQPVHEICFDEPFWIDRYEVTNGQFAAFGGQAGRASRWTDDNLPRESITWFEARDFCELREARLPTEAEWEYAARGPSAWVYPWGDDFEADNVVYTGNSDWHTWAVGSKPGGVSWVGALDMSGNVREWTSSLYQSYPYRVDDGREDIDYINIIRVLRGGAWGYDVGYVRAPNRSDSGPADRSLVIGWRCARSQ